MAELKPFVKHMNVKATIDSLDDLKRRAAHIQELLVQLEDETRELGDVDIKVSLSLDHD